MRRAGETPAVRKTHDPSACLREVEAASLRRRQVANDGDTSYEVRGGHRPELLSIVVHAGVLGVSPAKLGRVPDQITPRCLKLAIAAAS
jgi:hypothetical protein